MHPSPDTNSHPHSHPLQSTPKQKHADSASSGTQPLFPISAAPQYPTAPQIQSFLSKSRITETELTVEHVETLLNVLVLDGEIERVSLSPILPSFNFALGLEVSSTDADTNAPRTGPGVRRGDVGHLRQRRTRVGRVR